MKKLDHPNVVKLVEVLDDPEDDQLYMGKWDYNNVRTSPYFGVVAHLVTPFDFDL